MEKVVQISETTAVQLIESIKQLTHTLQKIPSISNEPKFLFAKDISRILGINLNSATNLMKTEEFPSKKVGRLKVEEQAFIDWCRNKNIKGGDVN